MEVIVELGGQSLELGETRSRNVQEIVVLVVVTNIECKPIEWTIIRVGLLILMENVVLRDEMSSNWME